MTHAERENAITQLHTIWNARDVPHIPDAELRRLGNEDIAFLVRFWSHKARWWDVSGAPAFNEEPPMGYVKMFQHTVLMPAKPPAEETRYPKGVRAVSASRNFGRTFKGPNGGHLTARQQEKAQKTTAAG